VNSLIIRIVIIGLVAVGGFFMRDRLTGNVAELRVGDCFDLPAEAMETQIEDVQHHPCTEPHEYEAYAELVYPAAEDAPYPGDAMISRWGENGCTDAFQGYVGVRLASSSLTIYYFTPTSEGWTEEGDHVVNCVLATEPLSKVSTSFKGSRR
jgi:hypothetical protein